MNGGPHNNAIGAVAVALKDCMTDGFKEYAKQVIVNAQVVCAELMSKGYKIVTSWLNFHNLMRS